MARAGDLLAVYGLLRTGEEGFRRFDLATHLEHVGPCRIPGRLYDLGRYPGLARGEGEVIGDLFRLKSADVIARLDDYEDYNPANETEAHYLRRAIQLAEPDVTAWVYLWNRSVEGCKPLAHGDWLAED